MKNVIVLVGLPASGKSTLSNMFDPTAYYYSTDAKVEQMSAANGQTYSEAWADLIKEATSISNAELAVAIKNGQDVIWDQTNLTIKKRKAILSTVGNDYTVQCICFVPPENESDKMELQRRLNNRPGKKIPDFVMSQMVNSFQLPTVAEGFSEVTYFDIWGNKI